MRIAINAMSLRKGGTVIALSKLLTQMVELEPNHEFYILADGTLPKLLRLDHPSVRYHYFSWVSGSSLRTVLWYTFVLPYWLARNRIDVLFSSSCYLPLSRPRRTVLLVQDAKYFYNSKDLLNRFSMMQRLMFHLKRYWTYYSVSVADSVVVQSESLGDRVKEHVPSASSRISTIPHGPGFLDGPQNGGSARYTTSDTLEVAYVALYRTYKNFKVLIDALKLLRAKGIPIRLHLTLDVLDDTGARSVMSYARRIGVEELIVNHGELDKDRLSELYRIANLFVFPSTCESFGFPQVEAMAFGLPMLVADTPVNHEICSYAAIYFPREDDAQLAALIERIYREPSRLTVASKRSETRARDFDWTVAARRTLICLTGGLSAS